MKKYFVVLTEMLMLGGYALADDTATGAAPAKTDTGMMQKIPKEKSYLTMKDGKMMVMKDGKWAAMDADITFPDGTVIMKDGNVTMKDGTKGMMKEGDRIDTNGKLMSKKVMKDCITMKDGKMMMMKDGKMAPMDADMTMPDGTMVMKDGTVMMKDGTKGMMKEGDRMDMTGKMMKPWKKKAM